LEDDVRIAKTKQEYGGRITYYLTSSPDMVMILVLSLVAAGIFATFPYYGVDPLRIGTIAVIWVIIQRHWENRVQKFEITVDKNMQMLIIRQKSRIKDQNSENFIYFENIKSIKFEYTDQNGDRYIMDYRKSESYHMGTPVLELKSGQFVDVFNLVEINEFSPIAGKINMALKEYQEEQAAEPSRVKSKSHDVSVKDL
jgi:hypothetical protein